MRQASPDEQLVYLPLSSPEVASSVDLRSAFRTKTVGTRLTPEEVQEVESAARSAGKSLAEWLRELALREARQRPADPNELLLSELAAMLYLLLNLFHATALAHADGRHLPARVRAQDSGDSRRPQACPGEKDAPGVLDPATRKRGRQVSRPLGFPSPLIKLLRSLLGASLLLALFGAGLAAWSYWSLTPLQNYYFNVYTASSGAQSRPHSMIQVWWVMKTAPGRVPLLMLPGDDVRGGTAKSPIALSEKALAEGWRGVALSPPERGPAATLAPLLQHGFYEDKSFGRLLLMPLGFGLGGLMFLVLALQKAKDTWSYEVSSGRQSQTEERHGRRTKGPQLTTAARWNRAAKADGIRLKLQWGSEPAKLANLLPFGPKFRIPKRLESSHIQLMGDTGSGKSSAIRQILRQVEQRGESAIVYDPAMDFVSEFYRPERGDLILNPLDARCSYWSLGEEIDQAETAATIAAAFLTEKEYEKAFFTDNPRRILAHLLRRKPQPRGLCCIKSTGHS